MRHDANGQKQSSKKSIGEAGASPAQRGLQLVFAQSNSVRIATSDRVRRRGYELDGCSHGWGREVIPGIVTQLKQRAAAINRGKAH